MDALFKKLNYKNQETVYVINAPDSLEVNLAGIRPSGHIKRTVDGASNLEFVMVFVTRQSEIDSLIPIIAPLLQGDATLWMCYPKGTSKKYRCDFNRDTGWEILGKYGMEGVRMVAIDADWSALRFRKATYIKKLTRKFAALSEEGKLRTGQDKEP